MVLASKGSYIFWGRSSTFDGGDRSADKHQAFNPMKQSIAFPEDMHYTIQKVTTFNNLYHNIEFDSKLETGTVRITTEFRDPFLLAPMFTYKGLPTSWTGTSDVMTFNFSNLNDQDKNIWLQMHLHDQSGNSNHLDMFLDGGRIISYKWTIKAGEPIIEEVEIKFTSINVATETDSTGAYACDIDNGFDDGSFDQSGVAEVSTVVAVAAASITDGKYFKLWKANGTGGWTAYYVWFDKVGDSSGDPAPTGFTEIRCDISGDTTAQQVSDTITAAITAISGLTATNGAGTLTTVTVTNDNSGDIKDIVDVDSGLVVAVTTQGVTALDGGWSNWDGAYTSKQLAMSNDCTITFNGAAFTDIDGQSLDLEFPTPQAEYWALSSLKAKGSYLETRGPWKATVEGIATKGNVLMAQPSTLIASKTQGTLKVEYGTTKYIQFTLARVEIAGGDGIESGGRFEPKYDVIGGAGSVLTFSWTASEATDPSDHVEHTNV